MTPDWNPELADDLWKELRQRTPTAPLAPKIAPARGPSKRPRIASRKARLAASGIALLASLLFMSARALFRGEIPLVGGSALICAMLGILLFDQTLPGPARDSLADGRRPISLLRGQRRGLVACLAIGTLLAFTTLAESFLHLGGDVHIPVVRCSTHALITGMVALASLLWIWRRTDPFSPMLTGALLGASSGIVGAIAVTFACSNREGFHLLISHGLTTTALAIVGAGLGRRWLTP